MVATCDSKATNEEKETRGERIDSESNTTKRIEDNQLEIGEDAFNRKTKENSLANDEVEVDSPRNLSNTQEEQQHTGELEENKSKEFRPSCGG